MATLVHSRDKPYTRQDMITCVYAWINQKRTNGPFKSSLYRGCPFIRHGEQTSLIGCLIPDELVGKITAQDMVDGPEALAKRLPELFPPDTIPVLKSLWEIDREARGPSYTVNVIRGLGSLALRQRLVLKPESSDTGKGV